MSRWESSMLTRLCGFPRVSGDEPYLTAGVQLADGFSPRERG